MRSVLSGALGQPLSFKVARHPPMVTGSRALYLLGLETKESAWYAGGFDGWEDDTLFSYMWRCAACGGLVRIPRQTCGSCGKATGLPSNVSLAGEDHDALLRRSKACHQDSKASGPDALDRLRACQALIREHARVSINLQPESLLNLLQDPRICWLNLNDNLRGGVMLTYPPALAAKRLGIEKLVFGADGDHLVYGALNLGSVGLYSYGACCVFLDKNAIAPQVSFLEENSFSYVTQKGASVMLHVPEGARALWSSVHMLATVKHFREIMSSGTWTSKALAQLVLVTCGDRQTDRFIEAQIRQPFTSDAISEVWFARTKYRPVKARGIVGSAAHLSRRIAEHLVAARGRIKVRIVEE